MTVLAAHRWATNAELIADVAQLGYLRKEWVTLDPTYGRGVWWKKWRPDNLVTHDIAQDGVDFRALPEDDKTFDAVAFDPPYVSVGGRKTTGMPDFHERYGLHVAPTSPQGLQYVIEDGIDEMRRVLKPKGILLVKCQDYISSGKYWAGTYETHDYAIGWGHFELIDRFERIQPNPRPQPSRNRRQVHARRNLSTLLVFKKVA